MLLSRQQTSKLTDITQIIRQKLYVSVYVCVIPNILKRNLRCNRLMMSLTEMEPGEPGKPGEPGGPGGPGVPSYPLPVPEWVKDAKLFSPLLEKLLILM